MHICQTKLSLLQISHFVDMPFWHDDFDPFSALNKMTVANVKRQT
jgi:hypothetical protein